MRRKRSAAHLLISLPVVSSILAKRVIAVPVGTGRVRVYGDEDRIGQGGIGKRREESVSKDGEDGVGSYGGQLRELRYVLRIRQACRHRMEKLLPLRQKQILLWVV
jgi:hypothetical protein